MLWLVLLMIWYWAGWGWYKFFRFGDPLTVILQSFVVPDYLIGFWLKSNSTCFKSFSCFWGWNETAMLMDRSLEVNIWPFFAVERVVTSTSLFYVCYGKLSYFWVMITSWGSFQQGEQPSLSDFSEQQQDIDSYWAEFYAEGATDIEVNFSSGTWFTEGSEFCISIDLPIEEMSSTDLC